ncbi:MAG: ester cyclase [Leptolyngbyaceae cyanobacterium bins.302]|nr:ester cyclase [Leptolyngbyaceae cyanobacterium bins.302]
MNWIQRFPKRLQLLACLLVAMMTVVWLVVPVKMPPMVQAYLPAGATSTAAIAAPANSNVAVALKFYEAYNDRTKIGLLDQIFAPDYMGLVNGRRIPGVKAAKGFVLAFLDAFPDAYYAVEDTVAVGDRVVIRWDCTATHRGKFLNIDPTGQPIEVTGITIFQLKDGKISRLWNNWDTYGLMQQLQSAG